MTVVHTVEYLIGILIIYVDIAEIPIGLVESRFSYTCTHFVGIPYSVKYSLKSSQVELPLIKPLTIAQVSQVDRYK